jgi:hypothetical protein
MSRVYLLDSLGTSAQKFAVLYVSWNDLFTAKIIIIAAYLESFFFKKKKISGYSIESSRLYFIWF